MRVPRGIRAGTSRPPDDVRLQEARVAPSASVHCAVARYSWKWSRSSGDIGLDARFVSRIAGSTAVNACWIRSSPTKPEILRLDDSKSRTAVRNRLSCFTLECSRKPSVVCHDGRRDRRQPPPNVPAFQSALARAVPKEPPPSEAVREGARAASRLSRFTEPANAAAPNVDVPTPRWTWTLARLRERLPKSAV